MVIAPLTFSINNFNIKRDNILKGMHVPLNYIDNYTNQIIDELIHKTLELAEPSADIIVCQNPEFINKQEMQLNNEIFKVGKIVQSAINKSSHMALFACTAGNAIEKHSKQYIEKGETLEGLIVDLIGSEIAEECAETTHKHIESEAKKQSLNTSNRYSPGYCNWPVSDQQKLFKLLKTPNSKIQITSSSLMMPIKSVSGIIGIGNDVKNRPYTCSVCDTEFCIYRDKK